jgi:hypothetical protein
MLQAANVSQTLERHVYAAIDSTERLAAIHEELLRSYPDHLILYRGQTNLYPTVRSGRGRLNVEVNPDVELGWNVVAGQIIGNQGQSHNATHLRKAVLQHYGFVTDYLDLTSDIRIAAWFATNEYQSKTMIWAGGPPRRFKQVRYRQRTEGTGYLIVLAAPRSELEKEAPTLFDISRLRHLIRPQRQQGWLMLDHPPLLPNPNTYWIATVEVDCQHIAVPFSTNDLFPATEDDPGYYALLNFPFVQAQTALLADEGGEGSMEAYQFLSNHKIPYLAVRAIDAPEYVNDYGHGYYDHKWRDTTIFEPSPMQNWFTWNFPLQDRYPEVDGNISRTTKISISPRAYDVLAQEDSSVRLAWPRVGSSELLFTYSQYAYDRVDELTWPFHGVWLHQSRDLVLEHPVTADGDQLMIHAGHAYEFAGGQLIRRELARSCPCANPEGHDARVRSMLRLTARLEREDLILIPHPMNLPNCYVVV